jgi:hypothetical protein
MSSPNGGNSGDNESLYRRFSPSKIKESFRQGAGIPACGDCALWRRRLCLLRSPVFHQREAPKVDLTLRLNALAVCAVFVFVGAIILGAF